MSCARCSEQYQAMDGTRVVFVFCPWCGMDLSQTPDDYLPTKDEVEIHGANWPSPRPVQGQRFEEWGYAKFGKAWPDVRNEYRIEMRIAWFAALQAPTEGGE